MPPPPPFRVSASTLLYPPLLTHPLFPQVILDVVFNHTAEGNERGPTVSFRGLDNRVYYMLAPGGEYYNYRYASGRQEGGEANCKGIIATEPNEDLNV